MSTAVTEAIGAAIDRVEGREKVTGQAKYAYEYRQDEVAYAAMIQSTVAKGTIRNVDAGAALELPGVLAVLWHGNAPRLHEVSDGELEVLQSDEVSYRGQIVGAVIADSYETARQAGRLIAIEYAAKPHDVLLRADHPGLYKPDKVNPSYPADTEEGDFDAAFAARRGDDRLHVRDPDRAQQPDGAPRHDRGLARGRGSRCTTPTRASSASGTRSRRRSASSPTRSGSSRPTWAAASAPRARRGRT